MNIKDAKNEIIHTLAAYLKKDDVEYAKELGCAKPEIVLHLDHGDTFETCNASGTTAPRTSRAPDAR